MKWVDYTHLYLRCENSQVIFWAFLLKHIADWKVLSFDPVALKRETVLTARWEIVSTVKFVKTVVPMHNLRFEKCILSKFLCIFSKMFEDFFSARNFWNVKTEPPNGNSHALPKEKIPSTSNTLSRKRNSLSINPNNLCRMM